MSQLAVKRNIIENTSSGCIVYDFPTKTNYTESRVGTDIISEIIGNPDFEAYIKELLEGMVISSMAAKLSTKTSNEVDPYDSFYLADVKPDYVNKYCISKLKRMASRIVDLSDTVEINDGWDD